MAGQMAGEGTLGERSNINTIVSLLNLDGSWSKTNNFFTSTPMTIDKKAYFASSDGYY